MADKRSGGAKRAFGVIALLWFLAGVALLLGIAGNNARLGGVMLLTLWAFSVPGTYLFLKNVERDDQRRDLYVDPNAPTDLPPFELPSYEERMLGWDKKRPSRR